MRLRNFWMQMGCSFVIVLLLLFAGQVALAVLYAIGSLIYVVVDDRKTVYGEKHQIALEKKYPASAMPDTEYVVSDRTIVLKDSFVKDALLSTINFTDYSSRKRKDKKLLDQFYSSIMAGEYALGKYVITKKEIVPGNDSPTEYYVYCNERSFAIFEHVFNKCNVGDCLVAVAVKGMPGSSTVIWLNAENEQHLVAQNNQFYQFKYLGVKVRSEAN